MDKETKPQLYTCLSPALLHLYDVSNTIVVVIDVLRATSTIATALYNGAGEECVFHIHLILPGSAGQNHIFVHLQQVIAHG